MVYRFEVFFANGIPPDLLTVKYDFGSYDIEHQGFRYRSVAKQEATGDEGWDTVTFLLRETQIRYLSLDFAVACSCVHDDGLYEETPMVVASALSVARTILAQTNPDAEQLRLARKVMELVGGETSGSKLTVPSLSVPLLHSEPASGDTSVAFPL